MDWLLLGLGFLAGCGVGLVVARRGDEVAAAVAPTAGSDGAGGRGVLDIRLLRFVSDRLSDPLSEMVESAEMLQEDAVFLEQTDFVPDLLKLRATGQQLLALVEDLHDLAALDDGRVRPSTEEVHIWPLMESVHADVQSLLHRTLATVWLDPSDELPVMYTDERRLRRALVNLVVQAVSMTAQGELRLRAVRDGDAVRFELDHPSLVMSHKEASVMIADLGAADKEAVYTANDVGLGWVMTRTVATWLGGEFRVELAERGTRFILTLPIDQR